MGFGHDMGIVKAMRASGLADDTQCVYLTGDQKTGTSFGTFFGAQVLRLGCLLSGVSPRVQRAQLIVLPLSPLLLLLLLVIIVRHHRHHGHHRQTRLLR